MVPQMAEDAVREQPMFVLVEKVAIALALVTHARHQVAHRHAGVTDLVIFGVREQVHERNQAAVTPADDANPIGVDDIVILQHPLLSGNHIFHLQSAVVDELPDLLAVAAAAAVIRRHDGVALL